MRTSIAGWFVARVAGRSMQPTLTDGDLLLCRAHRPGREVPLNRLVVVRLPGEGPLAVKRLTMRQDDGWWVERDNPAEGVDSWLVGAIPDADLVAVVIARLQPRPRRFTPGKNR